MAYLVHLNLIFFIYFFLLQVFSLLSSAFFSWTHFHSSLLFIVVILLSYRISWNFWDIFFRLLRGSVTRFSVIFFISWIEAIWAPDIQAKTVLLRNLFSRRYSRSQNNFFRFSKTSISREFRVHMSNFRNIFENFLKIQNWLTLHGFNN